MKRNSGIYDNNDHQFRSQNLIRASSTKNIDLSNKSRKCSPSQSKIPMSEGQNFEEKLNEESNSKKTKYLINFNLKKKM